MRRNTSYGPNAIRFGRLRAMGDSSESNSALSSDSATEFENDTRSPLGDDINGDTRNAGNSSVATSSQVG